MDDPKNVISGCTTTLQGEVNLLMAWYLMDVSTAFLRTTERTHRTEQRKLADKNEIY